MTTTTFLYYHHLQKVIPWSFGSFSSERPVIIFEEIEHVIGDKKGIFVQKEILKVF